MQMGKKYILIILLVIFMHGCVETQNYTHNTPELPACSVKYRQKLLDEVSEEIYGRRNREAFDKNHVISTELNISYNLLNLSKASEEKIITEKERYKIIENKLLVSGMITNQLINDINNDKCIIKTRNDSVENLLTQNKNIKYILNNFNEYYKIIDNYRDSSIKRKINADKYIFESKKKKSTRNKRQSFYRNRNDSVENTSALTFRIEDFNDRFLYISIENRSDREIVQLSTERCIEYQNDQGGLSCFWHVNGSLHDNYGNNYKVYLDKVSTSLEGLYDSKYSYGYSNKVLKIYPKEKFFIKFKTERLIKNTTLTLNLDNSFLGYTGGSVGLKFPESYPGL